MSAIPPLSNRQFALVDCNNFFVSCERVFNPKLQNQPLVVLSNNDGCVIARSEYAKKIGIPMGAPYFKYRELMEKHGIQYLSANFSLYADLSCRVMEVLRSIAPGIEIYSVDEAFLDLTGISTHRLHDLVVDMRGKIMQYCGIPVSIGIAQTRTLAKLANKMANRKLSGVLDLVSMDLIEKEKLLKSFPIGDVWGIGRQSTKKYRDLSISNVYDMLKLDPTFVRKKFSLSGYRTYLELLGVSCVDIHSGADHKSISATRTLAAPTSSYAILESAIATHVASVAARLRRQGSAAGVLQIFLSSGSKSDLYRGVTSAECIALPRPTFESAKLSAAALGALGRLYRSGKLYKRSGVILSGISPIDNPQPQLFSATASLSQKKRNLYSTIDNLNERWGKKSIYLLAEGVGKPAAIAKNRSPQYTSMWSDIPIARTN